MKSPKISVVIPSYNKVKFIGKTLDSIFDQKYPNLEVIIQDGGSNDGTIGIIERFAKKYPDRIRWESKKDKGQLDAINIGLNKATGEILTFINADDCYMPGAFAAISDTYIKNSDSLWFAGRGLVVDKNGKEIAKAATWYKNLFLSLNLHLGLLILNYLMQPSVFITHKAWQKFGPFIGTPDFITEYDLWLKLGRYSMPVIINKNISKFRIEQTTKTKTISGGLLSEDWKIVNKYTKNPFVLVLHKLNNLGRVLVGRFV